MAVENTKNGINISTEDKVEYDKLCAVGRQYTISAY